MERKIFTRNELLIKNVESYINVSVEREKIVLTGFPTKDVDRQLEDKAELTSKILNAMSREELLEADYQIETRLNEYVEEKEKFERFYSDSNYDFKSNDDTVLEIDFLKSNVIISELSEILGEISEVSKKKSK